MTAAMRKTFMECSLHFPGNIPPRRPRRQGPRPAYAKNRSDLQDFGDCSQSSQIGPHLVQPLSARPMATTPKINANRLNMIAPLPHAPSYGPKSGIFKPRRARVQMSAGMPARMRPIQARNQRSCSTNHSSGIRYRGSPARPRRCVRTVGAGSRAVDRQHRMRPAAGCGPRLAAGRDPAHGVFRTAVPARRHRLRPGADGARRHRRW